MRTSTAVLACSQMAYAERLNAYHQLMVLAPHPLSSLQSLTAWQPPHEALSHTLSPPPGHLQLTQSLQAACCWAQQLLHSWEPHRHTARMMSAALRSVGMHCTALHWSACAQDLCTPRCCQVARVRGLPARLHLRRTHGVHGSRRGAGTVRWGRCSCCAATACWGTRACSAAWPCRSLAEVRPQVTSPSCHHIDQSLLTAPPQVQFLWSQCKQVFHCTRVGRLGGNL